MQEDVMSKLTKQDYIKGILDGNTIVLSRAITLLESTKEEHYTLAQEILQQILPKIGNAKRIGITGVPGVGKSTIIEALGLKILEDKTNKIAVLAIDPSSQLSKGSILGDKTRMEQLSANSNAYIRPTSAGNKLGGVSRKTHETLLLCEAAGFNHIIIETVGVGQSETAVNAMVDCFLLLLLPGAGDELQGIKRGIMEMADIIAVNKSIENEKVSTQANKARKEINTALHYFPSKEFSWITKVLNVDALKNYNIDKLQETIDNFFSHQNQKRYLKKRRNYQDVSRLEETINQTILQNFYENDMVKQELTKWKQDIVAGKTTSYQAAEKIILNLKSKG